MEHLRIAVIGAGTAGLAAALFLHRRGHYVTLYEKFEEPKPMGAGLLLQPTGLSVLGKLGLDRAAIAASSPVYHLDGREIQKGRKIFDIHYQDLAPHLFGLGIHRHVLFDLLHEALKLEHVSMITSTNVTDITHDANQMPWVTDGAKKFGPYDLVIDAQGARSQIRNKHMCMKINKAYPYAAIWGICDNSDPQFEGTLTQRYVKACRMIGVLPIGRTYGYAAGRVAFFWSLRASEYEKWKAQGLNAWQNEVIALWPEVAPLVRQFRTYEALNFATYSDIRLTKCFGNRMVCIGDAAHATSPQLGQGANLALMDAMTLDSALSADADVNSALKSFSKRRKSHVSFYQQASGLLTPFFQSDSTVLPAIRDLLFGVLCHTPYLKGQMLKTLAGVKTGIFSTLNPGAIHPDYDLKHPPKSFTPDKIAGL